MYFITSGIVEVLAPEDVIVRRGCNVQRPSAAQHVVGKTEFAFAGSEGKNRPGHRSYDVPGAERRQRMKPIAEQAEAKP